MNSRRDLLKLALAAPLTGISFQEKKEPVQDIIVEDEYVIPTTKILGELISIQDNTNWADYLRSVKSISGPNFRCVKFPIYNEITLEFERDDNYRFTVQLISYNIGVNINDYKKAPLFVKSNLLKWQSNLGLILRNNQIQLDICRQIDDAFSKMTPSWHIGDLNINGHNVKVYSVGLKGPHYEF
jgi:hypothetical protein